MLSSPVHSEFFSGMDGAFCLLPLPTCEAIQNPQNPRIHKPAGSLRLLSSLIYQSGMIFERKFPGRITDALHVFFNGKVACMASGATTASRFGHGMLEIMSKPAGWLTNPATLAIR